MYTTRSLAARRRYAVDMTPKERSADRERARDGLGLEMGLGVGLGVGLGSGLGLGLGLGLEIGLVCCRCDAKKQAFPNEGRTDWLQIGTDWLQIGLGIGLVCCR